MSAVDRLGTGDLSAFWAEGPGTPFQVAVAGSLEAAPLLDARGGLDLDRLLADLERRTRRVPRMRQRVHWTRFGQGRPFWQDDDSFEITRHVEHQAVPPPGDEAAWLASCAELAVVPLRRDRPLWRLTLVTGRADGAVGLLLVVHHAMVDGLAGVATLTELLDPAPLQAPALPWQPKPAPVRRVLVRDAVGERVAALLTALRALPALPGLLRGLGATREALSTLAPTTPLSGPIGCTRRLAVVRRPLADLRAAAHATGVTVNDVVLAAVATGLRAILLHRGVDVTGLELRASMPVAVRGRDQNEGALVVVPLPVDEPDLPRPLARIAASTQALKESGDIAHADITNSRRIHSGWRTPVSAGSGGTARAGSTSS
ncbi:MAG: wax ester/triacylglycerol synthase domain-containing protein [Frankiaceae bacterium]